MHQYSEGWPINRTLQENAEKPDDEVQVGPRSEVLYSISTRKHPNWKRSSILSPDNIVIVGSCGNGNSSSGV